MTLKDRLIKLREKSPLMTVAQLTEITIYGDQQEREDDFLCVAAKVLHVPQSEVDEAVSFTHEAVTGPGLQVDPKAQVDSKIPVLDHGYVELIEAWGHGKAGRCNGEVYLMDGSDDDNEVGIVEAARQSTQGSFRGWDQDAKLLKYLYDNKHATPFEFAGMIMEVQAPIFVFREWHRHRTQSYNEMSARYTPLPDLYYMPDPDNVFERASAISHNRQAQGAKAMTPEAVALWLQRVANFWNIAETHYKNALNDGVPKELARIVMPVGHYTKMRASANLRCWLGFLTLRMDPVAQWEIREFAKVVAKVVESIFPRTFKLFVERSP